MSEPEKHITLSFGTDEPEDTVVIMGHRYVYDGEAPEWYEMLWHPGTIGFVCLLITVYQLASMNRRLQRRVTELEEQHPEKP